jgi:hypothetical protein
LIPVLPSLSSFFVSKDNIFSMMLENTSIIPPYPPSNNANLDHLAAHDQNAQDPYDLNPLTDETFLVNALSTLQPQHMPVTYVPLPPPPPGTPWRIQPKSGPRNNVLSVGGITSSLPFTEDSYLLEEREIMKHIGEVSEQVTIVKEVCFFNFFFLGVVILRSID